MSLFFNGTKIAKITDTVSGGVNLLQNTLTMKGFNNMNNRGESNTDPNTNFTIDPKEEYQNEINAREIKTSVFHVYAHKLVNAPVALGQDIYLPAGTWTLSFLARNNTNSDETNTVSFFSNWCENNGWNPLGTSDLIDGVWRQHQITFTTSQGILHENIRVHNTSQNNVPRGSMYFANFKLEAGSQATNYCPSYMDIFNELEAIKNKIGGVIANFIGYFFNHEEVAV